MEHAKNEQPSRPRHFPLADRDHLTGSGRPRCSAHRTNGEPCHKWPIRGGRVCRNHGGAAKHVQDAARRRIAALVDPALGVLDHAMRRKKTDLGEAVRAARDILDRAGFKPGEQLDILTRDALVDPEKVRGMTTEELETLLPLLRKLAGLVEAQHALRPIDE